jgi:hypothetical protein
MASTLPLTGDGNITINSTTPADGLIKLANPASGAGKKLTIQGSDATSGNNNGGSIVLTPGAKYGTGTSGGVGIGTTQPGCPLDISVPNTSINHTMLAFSNDGGGFADVAQLDYAATSSPWPFKLTVHNRPFIIAGGNVGIGTTNPSYLLDVRYTGGDGLAAINGEAQTYPDSGYGGRFIGGEVGVRGEASVTGGSGDRIGGEFQAQNGVINCAVKATVFGSTNVNALQNIAGYFIADHENDHGEFWAGYFDGRVVVTEQVGLGTTSPTSKLHISNDANNTGYITMGELSTDAGAPAANNAALFVRDNGSGKTQLCVRFNTGAVQVIATQP